ncbi:membrane protein insertase YidC [Corynebacterium poyangense]|uniref:Membrane protein insertase YidC n=1 Tax=Corynebacterium poyangense TaxID=2684405 RepID=A0A7H0SRT9_9CORY|nr:membrane protein insertase YidC [Corynebacterium poyangense]QNQ91264.1 membrane protein insertase YidC [Corynebacterium poyangense]
MVDLFVYPVSGVLKLWHLLLHNALGVEDSLAWILSMFGLVIVVRSLIAPSALMQLRSVRVNVLLRPEMRALNDEYRTRTDKESLQEYDQRVQELRKKHNYNAWAGCFPVLIQIPAFIGLYQVLLRMARPRDGLETAQHNSIGLLNSQEISAFLQGHVAGIPLPAYVNMRPEQHAMLGTTRDAVYSLVLPMATVAICFTLFNLGLSLYRNVTTLDWDSKMARVMVRITFTFIVIIPLMLFSAALTGPVPVAIVMYWVANNLWTATQNLLIHIYIARTMPLPEETREHIKARRQHVRQEHREHRRFKRWARRQRVKSWILLPQHRQIRAKVNAALAEKKESAAQAKAEAKQLKKAKSATRKQMQKERQALMVQQRKQRKAEKQAQRDQME